MKIATGILCFLTTLTVTSLALAQTPTPTVAPALAEVCPNIITVGKGAGKNILHKSQASGHLQSTGRARSCTLIYGTKNYTYPHQRKLLMYDVFGQKLPNSFYAYELGGCPFPARFYTGVSRQSCKQLQSLLRRRQGTREAYIKVGDNKCLYVKDIKGRQGAVLNSKPQCTRRNYQFFGEG